MESEESLQFLIARSTDPFLSAPDRESYFERLIGRINEDFDSPTAVFKVLSHKLLSPDQAETLLTLQVIENLVQRCGNRVASEVGKFKFLNNFIRLLSPKYQGMNTSEEVRQKSIELLYVWKETLRHLEKICEVYNLLRKQNVIERDPELSQPIPKIVTLRTTQKLASFEDEQKAQLLSQLLKSNKPEDLQAANRMIKSMVRAEDKKVERFHKRAEIMQSASTTVETLWSMMTDSLSVEDSISVTDGDSLNTMKDLYDSIQNVRPTLFRIASEVVESSAEGNDEDSLADILALNDQINKTIHVFKDKFGFLLQNVSQNEPSRQNDHKSISESEKDLIVINDFEYSNGAGTTSRAFDLDDSILCSLSAANSPAVVRRNVVKNFANSTNCLENDFTLDNTNFVPFNVTSKGQETEAPKNEDLIQDLRELDFASNKDTQSGKEAFDRIASQSGKNDFFLNDISIMPEELDIEPNVEPVVFFQQNQIQGILYYATLADSTPTFSSKGRIKNAVFYIVIINSTSPLPVENLTLHLYSTSSLVNSKILQPSATRLKAFRPIGAVENISQTLILLPLTETVKEAEMAYHLRYQISEKAAIRTADGAFRLKWF